MHRAGLATAKHMLGSSPDHREEDGPAADEVHQKENLLPEHVVTGPLLARLNDNVGDIGQDLRETMGMSGS